MPETICTFPVRGVTFEGRQDKIFRILRKKKSRAVEGVLTPEPKNPYDPNAIAVEVLAKAASSCPKLIQIGYVPREMCETVLLAIEHEVLAKAHKILLQQGVIEGQQKAWAVVTVFGKE